MTDFDLYQLRSQLDELRKRVEQLEAQLAPAPKAPKEPKTS